MQFREGNPPSSVLPQVLFHHPRLQGLDVDSPPPLAVVMMMTGEDGDEGVLKLLDRAFEHDARVSLRQDFDRYFVQLARLLQYVTEHDEFLKRLEDHKITLPASVQGWDVLRKSGLSKEQRQLVVTQPLTSPKPR